MNSSLQVGYVSSVAIRARELYPELVYWLIEAAVVSNKAEVTVNIDGTDRRIRASYNNGTIHLSNPND